MTKWHGCQACQNSEVEDITKHYSRRTVTESCDSSLRAGLLESLFHLADASIWLSVTMLRFYC